ncbi:helix-turn-helix domain-containing protein [Streptomyces sp. NPDC020875]|uniref:helix-turn-helix domain-containing protein n=1 Tax=Streptomyces sp. NPDC020875 TaxID=3154898 RepID=UPI0033EB3739
MGLAERRRMLGYSQEKLAQLLGVDRTTIGRWENGRFSPQPPQRRSLAAALELGFHELDSLLGAPQDTNSESTEYRATEPLKVGDHDDMIRREFLRILTVSGALTSLPPDEAEALAEEVRYEGASDFARMNSHLWQVYQLARSKSSVYPIVRDQMASLNEALSGHGGSARSLLRAAADLFQLAGEVAFDANRYADASASYALAAAVSKDAQAYDLWACALVRHAYIDISERRFPQAVQMLEAAARLAVRGDSGLATRHWVAAAQAEAYAGVGDFGSCQRALDKADEIRYLTGDSANGGWLRFDGDRLIEERGARYVQLGRLDLAEKTLKGALEQAALASGPSCRRKGAALTDLAVIGARRRDPEQIVLHGREALELARSSSSGYVIRRLRNLCDEFGPLADDHRLAELRAEIAALGSP